MYKFDYELNPENIKELNFYMALNDKGIQKKMFSLMISFVILIIVGTILLLKLSIASFVIIGISIILIVIFFPKVYWKVIFNRIDKVTNEKSIKFSSTEIKFANKITVTQDNREMVLNYSDIQFMDFTKNNLMLFCKRNDEFSKVVIPIQSIGDNLESFYTFLQKEIEHEK
ncbi:hypothetical protein [Anaerorhabdus sp.]|uniref:hypothetical protein n=1 Tax=Anaerorhabdus sp. TaxID=1872524 RepID=UPI002FC8EEC3